MGRWLKGSLLLLGCAGIILLVMPWWLGAALGPLLRSQGITFERHERAGYAHFRLQSVRFTTGNVEFTARQVGAPLPTAWLLARLRGNAPAVTIAGWHLRRLVGPDTDAAGRDQTGGAAPRRVPAERSRANAAAPAPAQTEATPLGSAPSGIQGLPDLEAAVRRIGPRVVPWLSGATLSDGVVQGFGPDIAVATVAWRGAVLRAAGVRAAGRVLALEVTAATDGGLLLDAHTDDGAARLRLHWSGAAIDGEALLWEQRVQLAARFADTGWLPAEASAVAEGWRLPAARLKLGAPYVAVAGEARARWRDGSFECSASAKAEPAADTAAPPFEARALASGNLREVTLQALHVDAPFASADLTAPLTFSLDGPPPATPARLEVRADLAKLPWLEARGKVAGRIVVTGRTAAARQEFELDCADLAVGGYPLQAAQAAGVLEWPRLELTRLRLQPDDASAIEVRGAVNWETRELTGVVVEGRLGPAPLRRWLPAGVAWTMAEVAATAEGPLDAPRHAGTLRVTGVQWSAALPFDADASWHGDGATIALSGAAAAGASRLAFAGVLEPHALRLTALDFAPDGRTALRIDAPATLAWSPGWRIDGLALSGPGSRLALSARRGAAKGVELAAAGFDSAWLRDWVEVGGPAWVLQSLDASGREEGGALVFDVALKAQVALAPSPAGVALVAHGGPGGLELREFKVVDSGRVLTQAVGRLPISWGLEPELRLQLDERGPLELRATLEPESPVWAALAADAGVELSEPEAKVDLKGTLRRLTGEVQARATRLAARPGGSRRNLPAVDDLTVDLRFDRDGVTLARLDARVEGQAVRATGQLPMDDGRWLQLWRDPAAFDWSSARAHLEIPEAELAPVARRFPGIIAAQGRLAADLALAPGKNLSGWLRLTGAATRPLAPFGSLKDITADLVLDGRAVTVRSLTASLGGSPVALDGSVALDPAGSLRLALGLKGANLPLVRNPGLLLRSDLDLRATTDAAGHTRLSGVVDVRDCLVLAGLNVRTLLPAGRRGLARQPPYFAVAAPPFKDWALALELRAPGTVRMRTNVYNGTASAQFKLDGTLGEPRAVGAVSVESGRIIFPFATFQVQHGTVLLREADPYHAVVNLGATAQRLDYQLRLEMTGQLPAPAVTITASPAMAAADALLLVMTGQPPAEQAANGTGGQRLALLGAYLGRGFFNDLGLGGWDRLEISSGEQVSRLGRETYRFEYRLGQRLSLTGEYDAYDAYNAGVKWRIFTAEGAPDGKK